MATMIIEPILQELSKMVYDLEEKKKNLNYTESDNQQAHALIAQTPTIYDKCVDSDIKECDIIKERLWSLVGEDERLHDKVNVHFTAYVQSFQIGEKTTIKERAVIEPGVKIGKGCTIGKQAVIKKDVQIGRNVIVEDNVTVSGNIRPNQIVYEYTHKEDKGQTYFM